MNTEKIFAELEGFAIYEPQLMREYLYRLILMIKMCLHILRKHSMVITLLKKE